MRHIILVAHFYLNISTYLKIMLYIGSPAAYIGWPRTHYVALNGPLLPHHHI